MMRNFSSSGNFGKRVNSFGTRRFVELLIALRLDTKMASSVVWLLLEAAELLDTKFATIGSILRACFVDIVILVDMSGKGLR